MADVPKWFDDLEAGVEWSNGHDLSFQLDHNDLVQVNDIDEQTGDANIVVYASTRANAPILFEGTVNVKAHVGDPEPDDTTEREDGN